MSQKILREHRQGDAHHGKSGARIFVCSIGYNPGQFVMFLPGEVHRIELLQAFSRSFSKSNPSH